MSKEDERFTVESGSNGHNVIDLDRNDQVVGNWPSRKDAKASAERLNKRAQNASR